MFKCQLFLFIGLMFYLDQMFSHFMKQIQV